MLWSLHNLLSDSPAARHLFNIALLVLSAKKEGAYPTQDGKKASRVWISLVWEMSYPKARPKRQAAEQSELAAAEEAKTQAEDPKYGRASVFIPGIAI